MFAVTTGVAGAVLHLCAMEGLIVTACCCHEPHDGPPVQLKRIDDCCGALISQSEHPPVATGSDKAGVDAPMVSALTAHAEAPFGVRPTEATWVPLARGSPDVHGPPLFISNCSYLI